MCVYLYYQASRRRQGASSSDDNLDEVFKVFDRDDDGVISGEELGLGKSFDVKYFEFQIK